MSWVSEEFAPSFKIACVSEGIEIDDVPIAVVQQMHHQIGTDEAGTTGDQNCGRVRFHHSLHRMHRANDGFGLLVLQIVMARFFAEREGKLLRRNGME